MPCLTERQLATDILLDAFITQVITESNDCLNSQTASLTESECEMDEWDESLPPLSSMFLQVVLMLYSSRYLNERITIPKSG